MHLTFCALFNVLKYVTAQHVYKHDMGEGLTAKLSATNEFTFTQPYVMVTYVLNP
jgi:hypothetical protein